MLSQAAGLLLGSLLLDGVAGALHASPPTGDANDLPATFDGIAASGVWPTAHVLQFAASFIFVAGLLVLYRVTARGQPSLLTRLGTVLTISAAAAGAVQYAVDGVALKRAVDAWASAAPSELQRSTSRSLHGGSSGRPRATPPCCSVQHSHCWVPRSSAAAFFRSGSDCSSRCPE